MRGWLNDVRSYVPPVAIGEKMRGVTLCTVVHSRIPSVEVGDVVMCRVDPRVALLTLGWMV
jgi:NADPH-dependent curcumin reductase CurA